MYCTARARIAPLAFSPEPDGTIRPSSLMPSLMLPRRRRSTSFYKHISKKAISDEIKCKHDYPSSSSSIRLILIALGLQLFAHQLKSLRVGIAWLQFAQQSRLCWDL